MKFVEIEPDLHIHSDQIVSVRVVVASYNQQGRPFKYEVQTTLIDGRVFKTPMDHRAATETRRNAIIAQLNS